MSADRPWNYPRGIIIEGVTGAGKTHTMKALLSNEFVRQHWSPYDLFREKETFGEFMGDLQRYPNAPLQQRFRLLRNSIQTATSRAAKSGDYRFIMERSHYSYYALLPNWDLYKSFDEQLAGLNVHVFLLWIPEEVLRDRSLFRRERRGWAGAFIEYFGSESEAIQAFCASQAARYEAIERSVIPHTVIDTRAMDWERYANEIADTLGKSTARLEGIAAKPKRADEPHL